MTFLLHPNRQFECQFSLLLLLSLVSLSHTGIFDISELRDINYELEIESTPIGIDSEKNIDNYGEQELERLRNEILQSIPKPDDVKYAILTSKTGQKFACHLPSRVPEDDETLVQSYNPKYLSEVVAASFYIKKCIEKNTGWWSYEVCNGKVVRQRHGAKNEADQVENSLGIFAGKYNMPEYTHSTTEQLMYVEEVYEGGTKCDLPDMEKPRKAIIRYECDPLLSTSEAYIDMIDEFKSCEYRITVKVGSLCSLKEFVPPGQRNARNIVCKPYISESAALKYLDKVTEKQKRMSEVKHSLKDLKEAVKSAERRRSAMIRTELYITPYEQRSQIRKKLNEELVKLKTEMFITTWEAATGNERTPKMEATFAELVEETDDDAAYISAYIDYNSEKHEDRGNLWYYFHDPRWDKSHYPPVLRYVFGRNGLVEKLTTGELSDIPVVMSSFDLKYRQGKTFNFDKIKYKYLREEHLIDQMSNLVPFWIRRVFGHKLYEYDRAFALLPKFIKPDTFFGGFWDMIIAEFVRAVREDIDNTAYFNEKAEVREKFILDLHDYMKQISYVFLIMMRIIEKNKLMMAVELERTKDDFAYQTYVGIMFHKHAINFVINGYKPAPHPEEDLEFDEDEYRTRKQKLERKEWAEKISRDFDAYMNSIYPNPDLNPSMTKEAINEGVKEVTKGMDYSMDLQLRRLLWYFEDDISGEKSILDDEKRTESKHQYNELMKKMGGLQGQDVDNIFTIATNLKDAKELLEEFQNIEGAKIEVQAAVVPLDDMSDFLKLNDLKKDVIEEFFSEELNEIRGELKAKNRQRAYETVVDEDDD
ncbi:hypothetical protein WR25_18076 isoform A [Diploscapter pachys]|uniref:MRH domain-containing protein n=3 Tax=Diploscapter pachys TaxID=2018661 RepID=A0A2A2LKC0_9BILA|nr:hypothetical protein WR25_18076 isoform A [Diploscapter pachys]